MLVSLHCWKTVHFEHKIDINEAVLHRRSSKEYNHIKYQLA